MTRALIFGLLFFPFVLKSKTDHKPDAKQIVNMVREQLMQRFRYDAGDSLGKKELKKNNPLGSKINLGILKTQFTINNKPTFLYGISYYGALGAPEAFIKRDLEDIKKNGFNWVRIWANWPGPDGNISAVNDDGTADKTYMDKLKRIVKACDQKGIVVDITLAHGNNKDGRSLKTFESHQRAVSSIVTALKPFHNWYLDLANERDVGDARFVSFEDLSKLRETAKELDPQLLITASAGNDISRDDLQAYLQTVKVDFISPHRPRNAGSALQTEAKTHEYLSWMEKLGKIVPVHYQEPFRRGYTDWQPEEKDYISDLYGAKAGGAAGWCFHNGDQRGGSNGMPQRSFDMHEKRLFDQLDKEEILAIQKINLLNSPSNR